MFASFTDAVMEDALAYLYQQYNNHVIVEDDWLPSNYQPKHYTTLALIHHEDITDVEVISVTKISNWG